MSRLEHHVSCGMTSEPRGTEDFERVERLARKVRAYAERLGFSVMYENADEIDPRDHS